MGRAADYGTRRGIQVTSQHVPGFHSEDPDLATEPWWLPFGEPPPGPASREVTRRDLARRTAAAALAATFALLLPAAIMGAWIRSAILSTNGYVAAVTPVAASPAVRATVQEAVSAQVSAALSHAETSLPPAVGVLAGELADLAGHGVSDFMASAAFQRLWADANRLVHSQLISVLNGDSTLVTATGGQVVLNLVPLVNEALHTISGRPSDMSCGRITCSPSAPSPPRRAGSSPA